MPLEQTVTFHITAIGNLPGILASGGLMSDISLGQRQHTVIGYDHIKLRRMTELRVSCHPGTFVGHYVPFYYCPRSPMLYVVNKGTTGKPPGCQVSILHLVTTVGQLIQLGRNWAISDSNAGARYATFSSDLQELTRLNWDAIRTNNWQDVQSQKQAEFLVRDFVPWPVINEIGCIDQGAATQVQGLIAGAAHRPVVNVRREWYYP